ncbi:hypothetical protein D3C86_1867240 [compost metagenome]
MRLNPFEQVQLVVDLEGRQLVRADLLEHRIHLLDLQLALRLVSIDHVQQQVGIARFLERGAERLDQLVRQVTDEADGIGEDHRTDVVELQTAQGRIEGGEQLVGSEDIRLGQRIEQGRLAGVGIAD